VQVLDNPTKFTNPFQFEITFECASPLEDDLEWSLIYVCCPENPEKDLILDSILLGPVAVGLNKFVFQADPPELNQIPRDDLIGVTVLLLTCSYRGQEFIRVGYYLSNEYDNEEMRLNPPEVPQPQLIVRNILDERPRVTLFAIDWSSRTAAMVSGTSNENSRLTYEHSNNSNDVMHLSSSGLAPLESMEMSDVSAVPPPM
jgi:histone chaperone ASF1